MSRADYTSPDFKGNVVSGVGTPSAGTDATNKTYVDTRSPKTTVSDTAPSSPAVNDVWIDTASVASGGGSAADSDQSILANQIFG